ncbi:MAG: GIY-YIG nuclease family protein [Candidatus Methanomethylophilaceae archaeon]|nr:GIY-YIG nuclease family protein [Candidatus Methanomethylophilaceae archaeon]
MIFDCSDREDLLSTGVYFLIGKTDDGMGDKVYVGEAENVLPRIFQHIGKSKEWQDWTECVMFVSKDNSLNKAMIKYLESSLYDMVKEADRCELVNSNRPPKSSLSESDESEMLEYLDNLRLLMGAMGHRFLEKKDSVTRKGEEGEIFYMNFEGREKTASMKVVDDGFLVLKGSDVSSGIAPALANSGYGKIRSKMIEDGTILNQSLTKDELFASCSAATVVISGNIDHPWGRWKTKDGRTLHEVYRKGSEEN